MLKIILRRLLCQAFVIQVLFLIALLPITASATEDNLKIAVVDVQYVIDNSVAVVELRKSIDKISETLHKEMADKEVSLKNKEKELLEKKSKIRQDEFDRLVNSFYKEVSIVQHDTQQKKAKLEQAHADAIAKIHKNVLYIISILAKEMKFHVALPISQILYTDKHLSITDEVISRLNETLKSVPINYEK